jgi:hypothetical protein
LRSKSLEGRSRGCESAPAGASFEARCPSATGLRMRAVGGANAEDPTLVVTQARGHASRVTPRSEAAVIASRHRASGDARLSDGLWRRGDPGAPGALRSPGSPRFARDDGGPSTPSPFPASQQRMFSPRRFSFLNQIKRRAGAFVAREVLRAFFNRRRSAAGFEMGGAEGASSLSGSRAEEGPDESA